MRVWPAVLALQSHCVCSARAPHAWFARPALDTVEDTDVAIAGLGDHRAPP
jgi:hypothetical protein